MESRMSMTGMVGHTATGSSTVTANGWMGFPAPIPAGMGGFDILSVTKLGSS
jgi:hypothetical protein